MPTMKCSGCGKVSSLAQCGVDWYCMYCSIIVMAFLVQFGFMAGEPTPPSRWFPLIRPAIKPLFRGGVRGPGA